MVKWLGEFLFHMFVFLGLCLLIVTIGSKVLMRREKVLNQVCYLIIKNTVI